MLLQNNCEPLPGLGNVGTPQVFFGMHWAYRKTEYQVMKFALSFLFLCVLPGYWGVLAQTPIYSNPSPCGDLGAIADFSCPDNSQYYQPSRFMIRVLEAPGRQLGKDVYLKEVRLIITHTWVSDLDIRLTSPSGKTVLLIADKGSGEENIGEYSTACKAYTTFSVASCVPFPSSGAPFNAQPFLPQESLLLFSKDGSNPIGDWMLTICDDTEQDTGRLEFVELVFEPYACLPITEVRNISQDTTSVVLDWLSNNTCGDSLTYIEYGPRGFQPGTGQQAGVGGKVVRAACPPFTLRDLPPDTDVDIYLRTACAPGVFSANACRLSVRTACQPPAPSTIEHFSGSAVCPPVCGVACPLSGIWQNDPTAARQWTLYAGATPTDGTGPEDAVDPGGKYIYLETSGTACSGTARLNSGCFEVQKKGTDACHLSFFYHMYGAHIGSLRLEASTDGRIWGVLWQKQGSQSDAWLKAYISLAQYSDGTILRFRFVATAGNGSLGDIGLDAITVYGSTYLGQPSFQYFADRDGDGYGNPDETIQTCTEQLFVGYVTRGGDCNDQNPTIYPGAPEILCDGVDNNCNGLEDDFVLPPPTVQFDTICSGEQPLLQASSVPGGYIFWYTDTLGTFSAVSTGNFSPVVPPNTGSTPQVYRFYTQAADPTFQCFSDTLTEALLVVHPTPAGVVEKAPTFCEGSTVELGALNIRDSRGTGAAVSFHLGIPATASNVIAQPTITPASSLKLAYLLTSAAGCTFSDTFLLEERAYPEIRFLPADSFSLCIGSSRRVEVQSPPSAAYHYVWGNGAETSYTEVTAGLIPGIRKHLSLQVTDGYGCTSVDSILYFSTSSIDSLSRQIFDVTACNARDGRIELRPLDGVPPFTYAWSGSDGSTGVSKNVTTTPFVLSGLAQGSYRITITDSSNTQCAFTLPTAYVNGPGAGISKVQVTPVVCAGTASGSVCIQTNGGQPSFSWSTGAQTSCVSGLAAGRYEVTVTEGGCSTVLKDILVSAPDSLKVIAAIEPTSCPNSNDGSIALSVFGGAGAYRFRWNTGRLTRDIQGLRPGQYKVTVTDAQGCTVAPEFSVPAPIPVAVQLDSFAQIRCSGEQNGYIQVSGTGGTAPYRYQWANGSIASAQGNLPAGMYKVTLTDFLGCQAVQQFEVFEPAPLQAQIIVEAPPVCQGDSTGILRTAIQGGVEPYRIKWNTGAEGATLSDIRVGAYWAQVEDKQGCILDTLKKEVVAPAKLDWNALVVSPFCTGRSDGAIKLDPRGKGPFLFKWAHNGASTALVDLLPAGDYAVEVVDAAGCVYDTVFQLRPAGDRFQLTTRAIAPTCSGGSDGLILLQPRLVEFPPLKYRWENGSTVRDRSTLAEGNYAVTITDAVGCTVQLDTIPLQSPPPLTFNTVGGGALVCTGDSTGFVELEVSGGLPPYAFQWQGVEASTSAVYNLKAGTYQVFIQDANGCPVQGAFNIQEPEILDVQASIITGNSCTGDTTVQIVTHIRGGYPPYSLRWNNASTDPILVNPLPGDYAVTVQDAGGCQKHVASIKVRDPLKPLKFEGFDIQQISCTGAQDGALTARITGGKAPYTYFFNGTSKVVRSNLTQWTEGKIGKGSSYSVVVTDALGCRVESEKKAVIEPLPLEVVLDSAWNGACSSAEFGALFVTARGGTAPYAFNWYDSTSREIATTEDLLSIKKGSYSLVVTDVRLCSDTLAALSVSNNKPVTLKRVLVNHVTCKGDANGSLLIELEGGRPPYRASWNGQSGGLVLGNIVAGSYQPVILDADNCSTTFPPIIVTEPPSVLEVRDTILPVSCDNRTDGAIAVQISGGKKPYRLTWQNQLGQTILLDSLEIATLSTGSYRLIVQDSFRCLKAFSYEVGKMPSLDVLLDVQVPSGNGADGAVYAAVRGGTPPYLYQWSTGAVSPNLEAVSKGIYTITVTDARNCTVRDSASLIPTATQQHSIPPYIRMYPNPSDGMVYLEAIFPESPLELSWVLMDIHGRVVRTERLPESTSLRVPIDFSQLPGGVYLLALRQSGIPVWSDLLVLTPK